MPDEPLALRTALEQDAAVLRPNGDRARVMHLWAAATSDADCQPPTGRDSLALRSSRWQTHPRQGLFEARIVSQAVPLRSDGEVHEPGVVAVDRLV